MVTHYNWTKKQKQWVDFGIHTEACMTRPETCGAAGGAISVWINILDGLGNKEGILSSLVKEWTTGSRIVCRDTKFQ